ncbi:MAG: hypothetical protein ACRD5B_14455, partial [Nitrososphaeraceae archaeon]
HCVYGTGFKNIMERFIQHIKDMTQECFIDYFPCRRKENCDRQHVWWNWLKMFFLHLYVTADKIRLTMFLIGGDGLS